MNSHPDREDAPPFKINILRQYKDCLSRQVGEAIAILLSKDTLLNSKNEYIQNCISRITVEEDQFARRKRLLDEEQEEKQEEQRIKDFKEQKRPTKRKPSTIPIGWKNSKRRRVMEVNQEPSLLSLSTEDPIVDQPGGRLALLRRRMENEKQMVINYMDNKREADILMDIASFWQKLEMKICLKDGKDEQLKIKRKAKNKQTFPTECVNPDQLLVNWIEWWHRIEKEADAARRLEKIERARAKKEHFSNQLQPNLLLTGWRGWWSRMEAESKKEQSSKRLDKEWMKARTITNNQEKSKFFSKYFAKNVTKPTDGEQVSTDVNRSTIGWKNVGIPVNSCRPNQSLILTPKRKLEFNTFHEGSPDKRRKLSFNRNLEFWQEKNEKSHTQSGPAISALRYFNNNKGRADKLSDQCGNTTEEYSQGKSKLPADGDMPKE